MPGTSGPVAWLCHLGLLAGMSGPSRRPPPHSLLQPGDLQVAGLLTWQLLPPTRSRRCTLTAASPPPPLCDSVFVVAKHTQHEMYLRGHF